MLQVLTGRADNAEGGGGGSNKVLQGFAWQTGGGAPNKR